MAAFAVMLAAVGSLCGAVYSEAINPALYGEKSRAAVAQAYGMRDDDAVTAYIGMDAARQKKRRRSSRCIWSWETKTRRWPWTN